jgi:NADH-quinone oxidoreductase subunit N
MLATVGMMLMASAENLLAIFLAMELTSLSLYALVAFDKSRPDAAEAALKYFFFGSMAAAFVLFGMSLIYGVTGSIELRGVATALAGKPFDPLLAIALLMILAGFGFKVAAVPFHLWAPDAYQCAPTPVAALVASGSKTAGFFLLAKVMLLAFGKHAGGAALNGFQAGWLPALSVLAFASMLLGNLAALAQRSLKRLLAYSAVAQAGYLLIGVAATATAPTRAEALAATLFYVSTYALTAVGAFAVAAVSERMTGGDAIGGLAGLARRSPWTAAGLLVFMLSLAGLPPFAGFVGKFYLFATALKADAPAHGLLWLVAAALLLSPLALYYYLKVLKQACVVATTETPAPFRLEWPEALVLGLSGAGVVILGMFPNLLLAPILESIQASPW